MRLRRARSPGWLVAVLASMACGSPTWKAGSGDSTGATAGAGGHVGTAGTGSGDAAGTFGYGGWPSGPGGRSEYGGAGGFGGGGRTGNGNGGGGRAGGAGTGANVGPARGGASGSGAGASGFGGVDGGGGRPGGATGHGNGGSPGQGTATYVGCTYIGGVDHIVVAKRDAAANVCFSVALVSPGTAPMGLSLPSSYGLDQAWAGPLTPCPSRVPSGPRAQVSGYVAASGGPSGSGRPNSVDVDVTLTWSGSDGGSAAPEVIRVTNLDVQGQCP